MHHLFIEITIIILFSIASYLAYKTKKLDLLIYATIFALLFENSNIVLFNNTAGSYYYSTTFSLFILYTPLFVILSWGIILFSTYMLTDRLGLDYKEKILIIPLLVVNIDLILETFAVSQGYWTWEGTQGTGFLAVPAANFIGWLGVSLGFIISYTYAPRRWMSCFAGYFVFLVVSLLTSTLYIASKHVVKPYLIFVLLYAALFITWLAMRKKKKKQKNKQTHQTWESISAPLLRIPFFIASCILAIISNPSALILIIIIILTLFEIILQGTNRAQEKA
jgi:uncharacterized membrane protein